METGVHASERRLKYEISTAADHAGMPMTWTSKKLCFNLTSDNLTSRCRGLFTTQKSHFCNSREYDIFDILTIHINLTNLLLHYDGPPLRAFLKLI